MRRLVVFTLLSAMSVCAFAASDPAVEAKNGMVVSSQHFASQIGVDILKAGGNAVDAAVAVGYAQAVTNSCCGNIGGGGFMTIHLADVEGIMYMKSVAGSDGSLQVVVTFLQGVDPDTAAVRVQNRVSQALSRLPDEVRQYGVTTQKQSPTPLMYVSLYSPDNSRDSLYLRNYLTLHVKDELS
ncbi:efflux RND transporter permease subunit, partial [Burkholderia sola]|uniref:efflux RND transporter permease subunit n=1 Tax=Burkholderia sola TaxID=2843302 RepID=UPI0023DDD67E